MLQQVDSTQKVQQRSMKYMQALARGCWVVGHGWLEACLAQQDWVPFEPYEASGDSQGMSAPRTLRLARQAGSGGLFEGMHFAVTEPVGKPKQNLGRRAPHAKVASPDKPVLMGEMAEILEACGAEVQYCYPGQT